MRISDSVLVKCHRIKIDVGGKSYKRKRSHTYSSTSAELEIYTLPHLR